MKKAKKKGISPLKLILLILGIILLAAVIVVITAGASLLMKFNNTSYEYEPPVEREDEFVMPDYPEVEINPDAEWMADDVPEDETVIQLESSVTEETVPQETEVPAETQPAETETEAAATEPAVEPETAETFETETEPAEIIPETEAPKETDDGSVSEEVPNFDPNETVKETAKETVRETKPETVYVPPETLPQIVNPAPVIETKPAETQPTVTQPAETIKYNLDASFANSANAVSVYGKTPIYKVKQKNSDIVNILVMGTDSRDITLDRGRSDTMIVVSYNSKTGEVKLTSMLRDSLVYIEGVGWNRINTAYFYGGVGLAINTVNQLYNLDIQQFVVIDFNGVRNFMDYIGGVEVVLTPEEAELYSATTSEKVEPGLTRLSSEVALRHMRNRKMGSDFERSRRQRDVIEAVIKQIFTQKTVVEIYDIADYAFSLIKTNISATDLVALATSVLGNASKLNITSQNVPYSDAYQYARYNGMSIISYDIASAAKRINEFIYGK